MPDGDPTPDYDSRPEAIRRAIETRILEGKMRPGDRLGLKSELQKEFDVAGPTIAQALTLLTNDGLISMRRGPGAGSSSSAAGRCSGGAPSDWPRGRRSRWPRTSSCGSSSTPCWPCRPGGPRIGRRRAWRASARSRRRLAGAHPSFETQRLIWSGYHELVDMADNELLCHVYVDLLDAAEALIVDVDFPSEGPEGDQERQRIAAHASLFVAVADRNVEAARHQAEIVRLVSRPLFEPG